MLDPANLNGSNGFAFDPNLLYHDPSFGSEFRDINGDGIVDWVIARGTWFLASPRVPSFRPGCWSHPAWTGAMGLSLLVMPRQAKWGISTGMVSATSSLRETRCTWSSAGRRALLFPRCWTPSAWTVATVLSLEVALTWCPRVFREALGTSTGTAIIDLGFCYFQLTRPDTYVTHCSVVFGRAKGSRFPAVLDPSKLNGSNGFVFTGPEWFGGVRPLGDVNGDGITDWIIVSSPQYPWEKEINVIFGRPKGLRFPAQLNPSGLNGSNGFVYWHRRR